MLFSFIFSMSRLVLLSLCGVVGVGGGWGVVVVVMVGVVVWVVFRCSC